VTFATGTAPTLAISGGMSLDAATVWNSTGTITFNSTTAQTITTNGVTIRGAITFNGVGGNWSLGSALTLGATLTTTLTNGTITLNGFTLTTGIFSSSNTNTRSIAFGADNIVLAHTTAATVVLSMATLTGFTYTGTGGFTATMSVTRTFTCGTTGGTSANAPNLTFTTGASVATITTAGFFNKLDYGTTTFTQAASTLNVNSITLSSTGTYTALILNLRASGTVTYNGKTTAAVTLLTGLPTIADTVTCTTFTVNGPTFDFTSGTINPSTSFVLTSGSFTLNGGTLGAVPTFTHTAGAVTFNASYATTVTGTYTLTAGTLTLGDGVILSAGIFSSTGAGVRSIAFGSASAGNINLTHTTAATVVLSMAVVTNFTYTGPGGFTVANMGNTRTFTFGTTGGSLSNAVNLTFTTGASIATLTTAGWFKNLDFGTTSFNPGTTTLNIAGNLTLSATGTYTTTTITPRATATYTFNSASLGPFTVNTVGVTITMGSAGGCTILTVTLGAVDFASNNFTCSSTATVNSGGTLSNFGTLACTTFTNNGSTVSLASGAINASVSIVQSSGSFTIGAATIGATPTFTHTAGTVTFNSSQSLAVTGTYTFTAGTLTLADGVTLSTGIFSSSNTNTRAIAFGSSSAGNINLTHTTATTVVLSMAIVTAFTYTGPGGFTVADMANTRTLTYGTTGGSISNAVNLTFTTGASVATLTTAGWFKNLDFGTTSFNPGTTALSIAGALTLSSAGTYTGLTFTPLTSATYTFNGASVGAIAFNYSGITITMGSAGACTTLTMTAGTIDFAGYNFTCSGAATYNSTGTLLNFGTFACTTFTNNGVTLSLTSGAINASTSFVQSSGSFTVGGSATIGATPLFTHTAGTVTFNTSQSLAVTGTYTFTAGTLNIDDGVTLSTGIFSSTNTNSRTINFGLTTSPGYIALTHTTAATVVLSMAIMTGLTVNALGKWDSSGYGPTQTAGGFTSSTTVTKTFTCGTTGGNSANAPCLYVTGTGATQLPTFTTASWFGDFNIDGLSTMTIAATTLNINSLVFQGYYHSVNSTSMNLNFVGSGAIQNQGDTNNTFGILGAVTINHSGTTVMVYAVCPATTVSFTAGTLECRFWANGPFNGYSQFKLTGAFTQTGGTWYNNAVYIESCTTYTVNGATVSFDSGSITATTSMVLTSGSFTFNGGTISALPLFTHTAGTVTIKTNQTVSLAATGTYTFTAGSLILENSGLAATLNTGIFSSSGTGVRSITFGNTLGGYGGGYPTFINLTHTTAATTVLSMATATNFTYTATYSTEIGQGNAGFASAMPATQTFVFGTTGGSITNSPNLKITGASTPTITTGSWFNLLDMSSAGAFTLPATSLNLNSLYGSSGSAVLTGLTANMRGSGVLVGTGYTVGPVVINTSGIVQIQPTFPAPYYAIQPFNCTTLTITAGTLDGGVQTFTGSCTAGVLTTVGSPTLVPGSMITDGVSGTYGYVGTVVSGSGNTWVLNNSALSFGSTPLATNGAQTYGGVPLTCSAGVTWTGGSLTNFGSTTALTAGGSSSVTLTCTTFTLNGPTFNHTLENGGTINPSTSFVLTSGSYTLNGGVLGAVPLFTHTAGTATFNYNYSLTTTGTYTLTAGTLTLADGVTLDTGIFSSTGAGTRAIGFGSSSAGNINLTHTTAATTVLNMATVTGFTYTGPGGFTVADMANTRTLTFGTTGGSTTTAVNLTFTTGASVATLTTASWFNNLDFGTTSFTLGTTTLNINGGLTLSSSGTYTGLTPSFRSDSTLTSNGKTVAALVVNAPTFTLTTNDATSITGALTLTAGALVAPYNITSGSFLSAGPYSRSITGSTTTYTITGAGATAWSFASTGSALVNGTTQYLTTSNASAFQFGTNSFTVEGWFYFPSVPTNSGLWQLAASNFPGTAGLAVAYQGGAWQVNYGTTSVVTGIAAGSLTANSWFHLALVRDSSNLLTLYVNGTGYQAVVGDTTNYTTTTNLVIGGYFSTSFLMAGYITNVRLVKGVAVYTGNFTVPTAPLLPTQSADTNISAITGTQTSLLLSTPSNSLTTDYSTNPLTVTNTGTATANILSPFAVTSPGITFTSFTLSMTAATAKTFAGGGATYPTLNQGGAGALTISGNNSFDDLTATTRPSTITFTISTTQTFTAFTLSGTAGNLVTINSTSAGTQATLSKSSGAVSVGYLSIRDSAATGGATWQAGATSTNVSNNTGWVFGGVIYTAGGLFFAFF
jgi:hypothetical protein